MDRFRNWIAGALLFVSALIGTAQAQQVGYYDALPAELYQHFKSTLGWHGTQSTFNRISGTALVAQKVETLPTTLATVGKFARSTLKSGPLTVAASLLLQYVATRYAPQAGTDAETAPWYASSTDPWANPARTHWKASISGLTGNTYSTAQACGEATIARWKALYPGSVSCTSFNFQSHDYGIGIAYSGCGSGGDTCKAWCGAAQCPLKPSAELPTVYTSPVGSTTTIPTQWIPTTPATDGDIGQAVKDWVPLSPAAFTDAWNEIFNKPDGTPKHTPEEDERKNQLTNDWNQDGIQDGTGTTPSNSTGNQPGTATGTSTTTTTGTDAAGRPITQTTTEFKWPAFCSWATPVCEFFTWFKADPAAPVNQAPPFMDVEEPQAWSSGLASNGSCPVSLHANLWGTDVTVSYGPICTLASTLRPLAIGLAGLFAAYILLGVRNRG